MVPWERKQATRRSAQVEPDIRYTVQFQDNGWLLALPVGVEPTPEQQAYMRRWTLGPPYDDSYTFDRLAAELRVAGGAELGRLTLRVPLTSARGEPIEVDEIRPVDIRRTAPYAGTLVNVPPQDSGTTLKMMFDLDEIEPRARVAVEGDDLQPRPGGLFFQGKTLTLNDREDVLMIRSITTTHAVSFDIRIDYRIRNKPGHLLVTNNGRPFAVTPMNCLHGAKAKPTPAAATEARNPALPPVPVEVTRGPAAYRHAWELSDSRLVEAADPGHVESHACA
ncbi:hypothetical protein [Embleya sp. NPDC020630]|uniref:hypothetical protein n=1 Tax=Embleya sp. NPDC020630 TaxID=3363979 RepID=UPI0037ADB029